MFGARLYFHSVNIHLINLHQTSRQKAIRKLGSDHKVLSNKIADSVPPGRNKVSYWGHGYQHGDLTGELIRFRGLSGGGSGLWHGASELGWGAALPVLCLWNVLANISWPRIIWLMTVTVSNNRVIPGNPSQFAGSSCTDRPHICPVW